jgi:hypothetical protein
MLAIKLLDGWASHPQKCDVRCGDNPACDACVVALAAHVHRLAQVPEAAEVFVLGSIRSRRRAAPDIRRTGWEGASEAAERVATMDDDSFYEAVSKERGDFRQLCEDLNPGGAQAYLIYRMLSWHTHASAFLADEYLASIFRDLVQ